MERPDPARVTGPQGQEHGEREHQRENDEPQGGSHGFSPGKALYLYHISGQTGKALYCPIKRRYAQIPRIPGEPIA